MKKYLFEIINEIENAKDEKEAVKIIQGYNKSLPQMYAEALRTVIKGTVDPDIKWALPEGMPPYEAAREHNAPNNLMRTFKRFVYFAHGSPKLADRQSKREQIYIQLLESVHPKDAALVVDMVAKKERGFLTAKVAKEAFGDIFLEAGRNKALEKIRNRDRLSS